MKRLLLVLALPVLSMAAILPEAIGDYTRTATSQPTQADRTIWDEYGLKASETATYEKGKSTFSATVWQMQDTTGALAAYDWVRPAGAKPSSVAKLAVETDDGVVLAHGNYVLSFAGHKPAKEELDALLGTLKNVDATSLPVLASYLPATALVPNSERYVLGPAGLAKFAPGIPPSVAGFRVGAEAQIGVFRSPKGDETLAIFNYPTPQIAMQRTAEFEKLPGALVKRSGPLVAVILAPPDPDFAEHVLGEIRYQAEITRDEYVPTRRDNIGNLVINAFVLIGILLGFCLVSGLALGGFRAIVRHTRKGPEPEAMITLHLENR